MGWTDQQARERVTALEDSLEGLYGLPEPARSTALGAVSGLLELYGEALRRVVGAVPAGTVDALGADELVGHLLMVHDLSPRSLESRVNGALDEVRPYLASHGGGVELVAIERDTVRLRLEGHCSGCPSSTATLKLAVEDAIRDAAPEVLHVVADGAVEEPLPNALPMVGDTARPGVWSVLDALPELESGGTLVRGVSGEEVLFARVDSALYAYRRGCPACGGSVAAAVVDGGRLACEDCGHRYEIAAAGRCADDPGLSLDPLPLLMTDDGRVKVAHREVVRR